VFDALNQAYPKFYNPADHWAVDKLIIKFKGRRHFQAVYSHENKIFGIEIYQLHGNSGCTYDRVHLGGGGEIATADMTATQFGCLKF
jgi:hypothetical protein